MYAWYRQRMSYRDRENRRELRRAMQSILIVMGHDLGPTGADGRMGPYTARALRIESNVDRCQRTEPDQLRALQAILVALGYDLGPTTADGIRGPYTRRALRKAAGNWDAPYGDRCVRALHGCRPIGPCYGGMIV